jgi:hypothetical protein
METEGMRKRRDRERVGERWRLTSRRKGVAGGEKESDEKERER